MKRWIFIVGITLIVILAAIWMYLLFFSNGSTGQGFFNNFNLRGTEEEGEFVEEESSEQVVVDVNSPVPLRQLTTRKVLAHAEIASSSTSTSRVLFVESGTGHVYSIDLVSGAEERLSNITVPMATKATLSQNGDYAAMSSGGSVTIVTLPKEGSGLTSQSLEVVPMDFSFTEDGDFLYTVQTLTGTEGKIYDPLTQTTKPLFSIPFRESVILWGPTKTSPHFAYPKTAARLEGYYYKIQNGVVNRLPAAGYAFGASTNGSYSIYSRRKNDLYETFILDHTTKTIVPVDKAILPEKCVYADTARAICAVSTLTTDPQFPDTWYKGLVATSEELWQLDLLTGITTQVIDLRGESGRSIDVTNPWINASAEHVYFINKIDQALWLFDSSQL